MKDDAEESTELDLVGRGVRRASLCSELTEDWREIRGGGPLRISATSDLSLDVDLMSTDRALLRPDPVALTGLSTNSISNRSAKSTSSIQSPSVNV